MLSVALDSVETGGGANGAGAAVFRAAGAGPRTTSVAAPPMTATTLLTGTVSPSCALISASTPAAGEGISASTLSVEISNSGSSRSTLSPTFLIQRTMVPSATDSPICGITTSITARSCVNRRPVRRVGRFADGLGHRRVRVDRANEFVHRRLESNGDRRLCHKLSGACADHVDAQHRVRCLVRDDLHKALGLAGHLGAPQHTKRKGSNTHVVTAVHGL